MRAPLSSSATLRSGLGIFALGLISVAVLNACGGGDAVTATSTTTTTTSNATYLTSSGSVTATFDTAGVGAIRYFVQGSGESLHGTTAAGNIVQDASGALTTVGTSVLAATPTFAVQKIQGDATFAMGRWTRGSATVNGSVKSLTGTDYRSVHYLALHELPAGLADGTYVCGRAQSDLRETGLTYAGTTGTAPASETQLGAMVPYATIAVSGTGTVATVSLQKILVAGAGLLEEGYTNQTLTFALPAIAAQEPASSGYLAGNEGVAFILGRDTNAANIAMGVAFRGSMTNGARYQGLVSIICSP